MTVIIASFGQWQPMQNYLKLDEHSWSAKLLQFWKRLDFLFFINERTISVKKSLSEHKKIQFIKIFFFKPSDFPFENSILEYLQPDSSSSVVARLELIILPFWQRPAEIGEIISISCGEGGGSAPRRRHRRAAQ